MGLHSGSVNGIVVLDLSSLTFKTQVYSATVLRALTVTRETVWVARPGSNIISSVEPEQIASSPVLATECGLFFADPRGMTYLVESDTVLISSLQGFVTEQARVFCGDVRTYTGGPGIPAFFPAKGQRKLITVDKTGTEIKVWNAVTTAFSTGSIK